MAKKKKQQAIKSRRAAGRPVSKSPARAPAKRSGARPASKPAVAKRAGRTSWLDEGSHAPVIDRYARQLGSFLETMADGKVDASELKAQEARLVKLMRAIEPELDDAMHAQITQLLCELTAYDIMQIMHSIDEARPATTFRG